MRSLSIFCILLSLTSFQLYFLAIAQNFDISASCAPRILSSNDLGLFHATPTFLRVLVPWKLGFKEFISFDSANCTLGGFPFQIFSKALDKMGSSAPQIQLFLYGNGREAPNYTHMVEMVSNGIADAIIADLTITKDRMEKVVFTVPYIPTKLVMVTPLIWYKSERNVWKFLRPLSEELWVAFFVFFIVTGYTLYILEYKNPDFDSSKASHIAVPSILPNVNETPTTPNVEFHFFDKSRIMDAYWFTSLCVIATQRDSVRTHLGRLVTLLWLLVMFVIFKSSYTASFTSLLSAQKPYPLVKDLHELLENDKVNVGYQEGSFLGNYLLDKTKIPPQRLQSYSSNEEYANDLKKGSQNNGIGVVIDELAYLQLLLHSHCDFTMTSNDGQLPNFGGFGFAFSKNYSSLVKQLSKEIVYLAENKTIKQLQSSWTIGGEEYKDQCSPSPLFLRSFAGLFAIVAIVYIVCIGGWLLIKALQARGLHIE